MGYTRTVILRDLFGDNRVCVFGALTSVGALFILQVISMKIIATLLAFFILSANTLQTTAYADTKQEPKVYITNTGNYYHSTDCHYLQSKIPIGLYTAQERGYSACSYCGGKPDGYYSWEDYENYLDSITPNKDAQQENTNNNGFNWFWLILIIVVVIGYVASEYFSNTKNKKQ